MATKRMPIKQRKDIFLALVKLQDKGEMSTADSITHVSNEYKITEDQLRTIMDEGIDKEWPPLDEAVQAVG